MDLDEMFSLLLLLLMPILYQSCAHYEAVGRCWAGDCRIIGAAARINGPGEDGISL